MCPDSTPITGAVGNLGKKGGEEVGKKWRDHVGERLLVSDRRTFMLRDLIEVKLLEVSPRGKLKFQFLSGSVSWEDPEEWGLEEALGVAPSLLEGMKGRR